MNKTDLPGLGQPEDLITFVSDRPGHDLRYTLDDRKIWDSLSWEPQMPFSEGLKETIRWYMGNKNF